MNGMRRIAGIDIGTNSVLYSLFEVKGKSIANEIHFERYSPRIGKRLAERKNPLITEESYAGLKLILSRCIRHAETGGADEILIAATNPLRLAHNGAKIRTRLEDDLRQSVVILSSDREAYLAFLAAAGHLQKGRTALVIDLGGGSTEFVVYRGDRRQAFVSLPEGAVSLTEKFNSEISVDPDDFPGFEKMLDPYRSKLNNIRSYLPTPVKLVGGTSTALAYLKDRDVFYKRRGVVMARAEIEQYVYLLSSLGLTCRRQLLAVDKKRAEIIFAGAFWLHYVLKVLDIKKAVATPWGLRHGMVLDYLKRGTFTA